MDEKRCVICRREIRYDDDYFRVELFIKGNLEGIDHAHRECWMNRNNFNNQLSKLVKGISNFANKNGILPEKEVKVII